MIDFVTLANYYQGVISTLGIFLIIPFGVLVATYSQNYLLKKQKRKYKNSLYRFLLKELWKNINLVAQIEQSYQNYFKNDGIHIPLFPPSTHILGKFFQFEILNSTDEKEHISLTEIYEQLESLKTEYYIWREKIINDDSLSEERYKIISSIVIPYIEPVMNNMLIFWISLVFNYGKESNVEQIIRLNKLLKDLAKNGKCFTGIYRASSLKDDKRKIDTILCWINDWEDSDKEIIELQPLIALHLSWVSK
ncbi:MAG: hypothetical protein ABIP54_05135 [Candidatus Andersenbacteria bacterium]